ncbi:MAG TPA: aldo/keto reductase [Dehalococcoidia bacterium]|nr:aldo/keto reductase [Dehalococcoidia bacterium]
MPPLNVPPLNQRRLGRSELMVTELGLGAMDTPQSAEGDATLAAAIDGGINFIDTAREYEGSEYLIGRAVRAIEADASRNSVRNFMIASKTFSHTLDGSQRDVDKSLSMLGVDRIDLYQLHDISTPEAWHEVQQEDGALAGLQIAKYRGLIDHIGVSSHSIEVLRAVITSGEFAAVMLEYSAFAPETAPLIELAVEHDVGVIVMRPLGGSGRTSAMRGRIDDGYDGPLTPANLLRYVLSNRGVSVAIPGARYPSRIEQNVATASSYAPMDAAEMRAIEAEAAQLY